MFDLSNPLYSRLKMTEILLKGRKTLTHPSIHCIHCKLFPVKPSLTLLRC